MLFLARRFTCAYLKGLYCDNADSAIAVRIAQHPECVAKLRQYALCNRLGCAGPFFRVLAPLAANGPTERWKIQVARRALLACCGEQTLQTVAPGRLGQKPHEGTLYYQQRQFYRWEQMPARLRKWSPGL